MNLIIVIDGFKMLDHPYGLAFGGEGAYLRVG
jgi:hypothetical protein